MSVNFNKLTQILSWVLMAFTLIFAVLFYVGGVVPGTEGTRYEQPKVTNSFIIYAYILLVLTLILTVFFTVRNFVLHPKNIRMTLVVLVLGIVLIGIAAMMADNTVLDLPHYKGKDNVPRTLFLTDVGLYSAYFLLGIAFLAIIYTVISKYFKK
jgi:RsiW-degrading membrane proteinase PrsW (M82 family)